MNNLFKLSFLIFFSLCVLSLNAQQILNPLDYVTVDNLNDNNTGTNGTILCDTTYCEVRPTSNIPGDTDGWWTVAGVQSISYGGSTRYTPRLGAKPGGASATFFFNVPVGDRYLVYTYILSSGNATSNAYITFKRFGEGAYVDSLRYDQTVHQILSPSGIGCWVPWRIIELAPGSRTLEVTIGADTSTQPYMRADAVRILRSQRTGADLEFGRRDLNAFDTTRVLEVFPQINFKFRDYYDKIFPLWNLGDSALIVSNVTFTSNRFYPVSSLPIIIQPGEKANLTIRFSPKGEETTEDTMVIHSNDWFEPQAILPVRGEGINYNFIMNASEGGTEPHWNAPTPAGYFEIGNWQTSTSKSAFAYPIPGGNLRSRYFPANAEIPVAHYYFTLADTLSGTYLIEYGGPYTSNATQTAVIEISTPFVADTIRIRSFNQNLTFGGPVWKTVADNQYRVFTLNGGGQSNIRITRTEPGSGVLRADLMRIRLLPIAPTASTSADNSGRIINFGSVSIYDSIRLAEFNYQKPLQIRSNGEQPLIVDSMRLIGRDRFFFKVENLPVMPLTLPSIDGVYNLTISFLPSELTYVDTIWNAQKDSIVKLDTIIGGIRSYSATLTMKTNDTVNNRYINITLNGSGVGTNIVSDDSDPTTFTNTPIVDWNPTSPTQLEKWQRISGSGTNNQRLITYIYGYQYAGVSPDSNYIEWFPKFPRRPSGPAVEQDSFDVYAILPAGSSTGSPRAVYEIHSPITGIHRLIKNQKSTTYGGNVPSNGRMYLGRFVFLRGGQDIHGGGTVFGHVKLINNFNEVSDYYRDSVINRAVQDSHVTRADAIVFEQVSKIVGMEEPFIRPTEYYLAQNYPNPFNPNTTIRFAIPNNEKVTLKIYDVLGREVKTLVDEELACGYYKYEWNGKNNMNAQVSTGIYLYQLRAGKFVKTMKMIFLK